MIQILPIMFQKSQQDRLVILQCMPNGISLVIISIIIFHQKIMIIKTYYCTRRNNHPGFVGSQHSAALASNGRLFTWGYNGYSQLGDGSAEENLPQQYSPTVYSIHR